jgi:hypothetical protein
MLFLCLLDFFKVHLHHLTLLGVSYFQFPQKIQAQLAKAIEAQPSDLRLTLDGGTLDPDSTPKNEDLEDEDIIEVETVGE